MAGLVRVVSVRTVRPERITLADALRAGLPDADAVRKRLAGEENLTTYRVELEWAGEDPRIALREDADLTERTSPPWTHASPD